MPTFTPSYADKLKRIIEDELIKDQTNNLRQKNNNLILTAFLLSTIDNYQQAIDKHNNPAT